VRVVHFLTPIDRAANPRPLSARAETVAYPALERAVRASGGEFVPWIDLLPGTCFGKFEDGSDDAFHVKAAGHEILARRIVETLAEAPNERANAPGGRAR
jgi:lysophospholipase L1-like esterase